MESEVRRRGEQESAATPCRPRLENSQGVENRNGNGCLDGAEPMTIDQCQKVRGIDDSQIGGGAGVAEAKIVERKRRGRPPRSQAKTMAVTSPQQRKQSEEEDVCFICFDGGSLVLCDRRGCPKAYHPACIKRDEAFFRSKAKWNCGWHICSSCQKASHYSCYTCTYSLCKGCTKGADFVCVRENKGFCGTCMRTIMLFENNALGKKDTVQVDFDDKNSWEYLFKLYWVHLKEKLFLTLDELTKAKNPWKENAFVAPKGEFINDIYGGMVKGSNLEIPCGELEGSNSKRRKTTREQNLPIKEENAVIEKTGVSKEMPSSEAKNWATKELLELVAHMKSGDTSILSYSDVQALLLDYITVNNLRDPHQMSQVLCDARLLKLFGKGRLGHFEMLKLLESHFLTEDCSSAASTIKSGIVAAVASPLAIDENLDNQYKVANDKRRKTRKRVDEVAQQINLDEYAAIDVHNITLIFLKRDLMECLIDDAEKFHEKVVGCIVRIRISGSGSDQKQDKYRLVQVIGTSKAAEPYTVGTRTTDIMLEIRNLHKRELVSIDGISNQEFSEDECRWLRQCIKCGLMKQLTVGEIQKKAMALQTLRVKLWLDSEILRLEHLRDRANEKGHRKELRECVEKLQLLHSPEERQRRLHEIPQVHADPNMKPSTRFIEDIKELDEKKKDNLEGPRNTGIATKEMKSVSPVKGGEVTDDIGNRENDAPSSSTGLEPFLSSIETEKIWHYQDPSGKTHGPFSISMLKKWSVSGCFPSDLRIWKTDGKQDDSILLTDVLSGKYFKMIDLFGIDSSSPLGAGITPSDEKTSNSKDSGGEANREQIESKKSEAGWNLMECSTAEHCDGNNEFPTSNERGSGISCVTTTVDLNSNGGQNESPLSQGDAMKVDIRSPGQPQVCSSLPSSSVSGQQFETQSDHTRKDRGGWGSGQNNIDCNSSKTGEDESITVRGMEDENNGNTDQPFRQSWMSQPTSRSSDNWGSDAGILSLVKALEASVENKEIDFLDLTSPRPKFHDDSKVQATETKPSPPVQDSIPSWSTASSLVRGGPQLPEVAGQWKPSVEEWDSDLVPQSSFKRELTSDHAATPTSGSDHITHSSPAHLATTISSWQAIIPGPVSDLSLADESVSDLLAEVEAMESLNGLTSPTSKLRYNAELSQVSEHDCFSPVEELSPGLDLGKNDALSSTNDLRMSSVTTQHFLVPKTEIIDTRNISAAHSSSSSTSQTGTHLDMQHSTPLMSTWGIATTTTRDTSWGSMHGNLNLNNDGFGQGGMDIGYGTSQVRIHENASMNSGTNHARVQENGSMNSETYAGGNSGYWSNQVRYSGSRDRDFQGRDSSSLNNRGRASWSSNNSNRQPFYPGANGVNSHRAPPKGQRVCKFYGNGGCKKGASCNYWHPHP